jgi:quercetin dioxygenase-like cupin family protein
MASDHAHDHQETVFLMEGNAEVIIGDNIQTVLSPAKIIIPANAYHKFTALTDVIGLEIK